MLLAQKQGVRNSSSSSPSVPFGVRHLLKRNQISFHEQNRLVPGPTWVLCIYTKPGLGPSKLCAKFPSRWAHSKMTCPLTTEGKALDSLRAKACLATSSRVCWGDFGTAPLNKLPQNPAHIQRFRPFPSTFPTGLLRNLREAWGSTGRETQVSPRSELKGVAEG